MTKILCISGVRGSGKSLLASYLEHEHGYERFSLADELKREVMKEWNIPASMLWGKDKEVPTQYKRDNGHPLTARDIMIRHGVYKRFVDSLYFCKKFDPTVSERIVIDDLRFKNEVEFFKTHGAEFVRIERLPELNVYKAALDDLSETELNAWGKWDYVLKADDNKCPEDLQKFAKVIA